ncbi:MAG: hypothetical protein E6J47_00025 [Chloroflexi bacterium]|nr:MAG: hypothetical protein E6J47_00025 [Chloroflexota bacterium]
MKTVRAELGDLAWLLRMLMLAAIGGAIYREMRLPAEERTWRGKLLGVVPYDFRLPTPRRVLDAYWNPERDNLFADQPFGVGWAVNLPVLLRSLGTLSRRSGGEETVKKAAGKKG